MAVVEKWMDSSRGTDSEILQTHFRRWAYKGPEGRTASLVTKRKWEGTNTGTIRESWDESAKVQGCISAEQMLCDAGGV